jgi:hypothetical protein
MRKVAGYALFSGVLDAAGVDTRFEAVSQMVSGWLASKGTAREVSGRHELVLRDGRVATYSSASWQSEEGKVEDHTLTEPSGNALIRTQVSIAAQATQVIVYVELQAAGDAYQVGPMRVDIRCPQLVRNVVSSFQDWHVGEAPLQVTPLEFAGAEDGRLLESVIWHPQRNLPVVALSSYEGWHLTEVFPRDLASDLVGVGLVATLDEHAAWEITTRRGQEWSCFNGAVRLYWPGLNRDSKPMQNPLWTRLSILSNMPTPEDAATRLKRQLRHLLLGLSAFGVPEPAAIGAIRKSHADSAAEQTRSALRHDNDWEGLANSYSEENTQLKKMRDELTVRAQDLEAQVAALQLSLQWKAPDVSDIEPDAAYQPSTVEEAVDSAAKTFNDQLVFGDDVRQGLGTIAADAGPPDKVLAYLGTLAEMVNVRRSGGLGTTATKWLQDKNVTVSGESLTIKNSADEQRKRTWHDGSGRRTFDLHLKPSDGTHPDRCVRIYFEYDDTRRKAVVGWVGRHP